MKKTNMKKYFSFLLVAALFAACTPNNEIGTPFKAGQEVTLSAQMPNAGNNGAQQLPGKQRVSGKDDTDKINLTWDEGDVILVKVGDKTAEFTLQSGEGTAQATFKGIMPADGNNFSVQYPVEDPDLSNQTYVPNGFGKGLMKMATTTNGTIDGGFTLSPQHTLLGLQLKGSDDLSKIVLTNREDASETYTLTCTGVTLKEDASTLFYIVVPKVQWNNGFRVDVYAADNSILNTFEKTDRVSFEGSAVAMPEQDVNIKSFTVNGVSFRMIAVKGGTFTMGLTPKQKEFKEDIGDEASNYDKNAHRVTLTYDYHIGETEVTQELWKAVMGTNPSRLNGDDYKQHPVDSVRWDTCQVFVTKLNEILAAQLNGRTFRLPTDAEWEYAARGGHKKDHDKDQEYIFAGSDDANEVAWYSIKGKQDLSYSQPVTRKMPNELGLYDMSGNVEEWCQNYYYDYTTNPQNDPMGPETGDKRVTRGGRWKINSGDGSRFCRVGYRYKTNLLDHHDYIGLRLALVENK
mgnify:CR=1 FL=1